MSGEFQTPMGIDQPGMQAVPINRQHTFMIRHEGFDGLREGQFTTKKLAIREHTSVTVKKIQLNGGYHYDELKPGMGIDQSTDFMNHIMASLAVCLVQKPAWFNVDTCDDLELLQKVYMECIKFENSFTSPLSRAATGVGGSQEGSGGARQQSGAAGSVTAVGRGAVPPTLDP
jgi:hypothetical protein